MAKDRSNINKYKSTYDSVLTERVEGRLEALYRMKKKKQLRKRDNIKNGIAISSLLGICVLGGVVLAEPINKNFFDLQGIPSQIELKKNVFKHYGSTNCLLQYMNQVPRLPQGKWNFCVDQTLPIEVKDGVLNVVNNLNGIFDYVNPDYSYKVSFIDINKTDYLKDFTILVSTQDVFGDNEDGGDEYAIAYEKSKLALSGKRTYFASITIKPLLMDLIDDWNSGYYDEKYKEPFVSNMLFHETLHAFGIGHTDSYYSIMNKSYRYNAFYEVGMGSMDVQLLCDLYAKNNLHTEQELEAYCQQPHFFTIVSDADYESINDYFKQSTKINDVGCSAQDVMPSKKDVDCVKYEVERTK